MTTLPKVICLMGATGSGKTAAALQLAAALNGEVINADSRQVYADFPCITAQPSIAEQNTCPHHLYGFLATQEAYSVGKWLKAALPLIMEITARGRVPILVGGTGLYFKALINGMADIPPIDATVSAHIIARCHAEGTHALYRELTVHDPAYAVRIHPHDTQRICRALEVWHGTGQALSWWHTHAHTKPHVRALCLGLDVELATLTPRLAARIDSMLAQGAVAEAQNALQQCADTHAPGWSGIGCAELGAHITGKISLADACTLWLRHTRAYAKRQRTWFLADAHIHWCTPVDFEAIISPFFSRQEPI